MLNKIKGFFPLALYKNIFLVFILTTKQPEQPERGKFYSRDSVTLIIFPTSL